LRVGPRGKQAESKRRDGASTPRKSIFSPPTEPRYTLAQVRIRVRIGGRLGSSRSFRCRNKLQGRRRSSCSVASQARCCLLPLRRSLSAPPFRCPSPRARLRPRQLPARRLKHLGANRTFKEFGPTSSIPPYNAPPSMRTRNSSPRRSGKNWTSSAESISAMTRVRSAAPRSTSGAPTTRRF